MEETGVFRMGVTIHSRVCLLYREGEETDGSGVRGQSRGILRTRELPTTGGIQSDLSSTSFAASFVAFMLETSGVCNSSYAARTERYRI